MRRLALGGLLAAGLSVGVLMVSRGPVPHPSTASSPSDPASQGISSSVTRDGIRLTLQLEPAPLRPGTETWATVTVENVGPNSAWWVNGGCSVATTTSIVLGGDWVAGVDQPGIFGAFKKAALHGQVGGAPYLQMTVPVVGPGGEEVGCSDMAVLNELPAGASLTDRARWKGWEDAPEPSVGVHVVTVFPFAGRGDKPEAGAGASLEVTLDTQIVDGQPWLWMTPAQAVDAALADPAFRDWLVKAPQGSWINPSLAIDMESNTWQVGLYRDTDEPRWFMVVTMDAMTGEVRAPVRDRYPERQHLPEVGG